jgi:lipopolysaccharide heptosyltransferase II
VKRILVIQTAFLGDVILSTPVVSELKRLYPNSNIDILVKKGNESLVNDNPKIHQVYVFDKTNGKWASIMRLTREFRKNRYDLVINLHRFGSSGIICAFSGAKLKYGFKKNPFSFSYSKSFEHTIGDGTHEVERNLSILKEFGAVEKLKPELFPSEAHFAKVHSYTSEKYICLAPASVWFTKQLPTEKWVELIQKKTNEGTVCLLGGPADFNLCEKIRDEAKRDNVINLAGKLSLMESAALMKGATMNFVNDSGPLHIASAMNAPVTTFFCSTIPDFGFGPLSDDSTIIEVNGLDCRPCGLHGHSACPKGHFKCGKEIQIS